MESYIYEAHNMADSLLPFIFHRNTILTSFHSPPNWHDNIEILYCIGGEGYIRSGPETLGFSKGDIFVVNTDVPHCICSDTRVEYHCLIVDNAFCTGNGLPVGELYFRSSIRDESVIALFARVVDAFERYDRTRLCAAADIRYEVLGLLRMLCRNYTVPRPRGTDPAANAHVKKAVEYIRKNISRVITLDDIAGYVGISKYHLAREFKAFTNQTMIQTVNLIRCTQARGLIERGVSISAAAAACGFENLSYFSKTFKKVFGVLPSAVSKAGGGKMTPSKINREQK